MILEAVEKSGYKKGQDFKIAIDAAATEMYQKAAQSQQAGKDKKKEGKEKVVDAEVVDDQL